MRAHEWLLDNAGPIIRWRLSRDFELETVESPDALLGLVLQTDEVQRWLGNLGGKTIHGSKDTHAENAMAKLVEYGLRAGIPEFDSKMLSYASRFDADDRSIDALIGVPLMIAAGYGD